MLTAAIYGATADDRARTAFVGTDPVIPSFNTQLTSSTAPLTMADVWADGLLSYQADGTLEGHLAEAWSVSEDGKEVTFKLRKGVKWSDGQPFTAADVKFTIEQVAKLNTYQRAMVEVLADVETPDEHTVVVRLKAPFAPIIRHSTRKSFRSSPSISTTAPTSRTIRRTGRLSASDPISSTRWKRGSQ